MMNRYAIYPMRYAAETAEDKYEIRHYVLALGRYYVAADQLTIEQAKALVAEWEITYVAAVA